MILFMTSPSHMKPHRGGSLISRSNSAANRSNSLACRCVLAGNLCIWSLTEKSQLLVGINTSCFYRSRDVYSDRTQTRLVTFIHSTLVVIPAVTAGITTRCHGLLVTSRVNCVSRWISMVTSRSRQNYRSTVATLFYHSATNSWRFSWLTLTHDSQEMSTTGMRSSCHGYRYSASKALLTKDTLLLRTMKVYVPMTSRSGVIC